MHYCTTGVWKFFEKDAGENHNAAVHPLSFARRLCKVTGHETIELVDGTTYLLKVVVGT